MNLLDGQNLIKQKEFGKALKFFLRLEKDKIQNHKIFFFLGLIYFELNHFDKSSLYYHKFLDKEPKSEAGLLNLAILKQTIGELEKSKEIYFKLINLNKFNVRAYYGIYILDSNLFTHEFYKNINQIYKNNNLNLYDKGIIEFLFSKREKKIKNYKQEIEYLKNSHINIFNSNYSYNLSSQFYYKKIINYHFDKFKIKKEYKDDKNLKFEEIEPIYIVGLPRSGSTLIESILSSTKDHLISFGECHVVNMSILDQIGSDIYSSNYNNEKFEFKIDYGILGNTILNKYSEFSFSRNKKFIDKSLENFFNIEAIINIFPKAKFIHTYRNILDSIISIYQSMLPELSWVHNLDDIFNYVDSYLKVINHFKKKYSENIIDINLEKFTINSEEYTRKMFDFCNLKWSADVLKFYQRENLYSKTLSFNQIRSNISIYNEKKYKPYFYLLESHKKKYKWLNM